MCLLDGARRGADRGRARVVGAGVDRSVAPEGLMHMPSRLEVSFILPMLGMLVLLASPRSAEACGGLFCDGPMPMPVDQRGEDILFVLDGSTVEVHIRIEYTGEAARFAWI